MRRADRENGVKSGRDQITQHRECMCLVEGCRPARLLGGRIQRKVDLKVGRLRAKTFAGELLE